jgi:uncharacterized membrane protein YfhO
MFPFARLSHEYGMANVYSGVFVLFLIVMFFAAKEIVTRKKAAYLSALLFLILSLNVSGLNFMWHGFRNPNQLPGRWTFVFSFFVLLMSYEAVCKVFADSENRKKRIYAAAVAAVIICEVCVNAVAVLPRDTTVSDINEYTHAHEPMKYFVDTYDTSNARGDFYRVEMAQCWTFNSGMLYGYRGITYYSSLINANVYEFFANTGCQIYAENAGIVYTPDSPFYNSLFSVKYIAGNKYTPDYFGMTAVDEIGDYKIWEYEYPLPLGFIADRSLRGWNHKQQGQYDPLIAQSRFFTAALGEEYDENKPLLIELDKTVAYYNNASFDVDLPWDNQYYHRHIEGEPVTAVFHYTLPQSGRVFMSHGFKAGDFTVTYEGGQKIAGHGQPIVEIGYAAAGTEVSVEAVINDVNVGLWGLRLYVLDEENFANACAILAENSLNVTAVGGSRHDFNTWISGEISVTKQGILYTSIPDDGGWTVESGGKSLQTFSVGGAFLAVELPPGEHTLEFRYTVPGFNAGLGISIFSLAVLAGYVAVTSRINRSRRGNHLNS